MDRSIGNGCLKSIVFPLRRAQRDKLKLVVRPPSDTEGIAVVAAACSISLGSSK